MGWEISPATREILRKAQDLEGISEKEACTLLRLDLYGRDTRALMHLADEISRREFDGKGENHFHIGINSGPCPFNCTFCSLAATHGIFKENRCFPEEEILGWARSAKEQGADAINLMTTGTFPLEKLIDIGKIISKEVSIPLVANTRDISHREAETLLDAGFSGFYHAIRLGEGRDTPFTVGKRTRTIEILNDTGLRWMNCVEPAGPEHTAEEIARLMVLARKFNATYSGVMRRINFPGSPHSKNGMISELEMARIVAVGRLVMGNVAKAHCTHEPHSLSLITGANLFFPEAGSSPRDSLADTRDGRGMSVQECRRIFTETGWNPDKESNCFNKNLRDCRIRPAKRD